MNLKFLFGTLVVALVMVGCRQSAETPESAARHVEMGLQKFATGQYHESSEAYSKAIQLDPGNAAYFNFRGMAHRKLGEWEAARADFTQAIERNSKESRYFLNRAETHELLGNSVDAILDYKKAEELGATEASKALKRLRAKAPSVHLEIEQISEQPETPPVWEHPGGVPPRFSIRWNQMGAVTPEIEGLLVLRKPEIEAALKAKLFPASSTTSVNSAQGEQRWSVTAKVVHVRLRLEGRPISLRVEAVEYRPQIAD